MYLRREEYLGQVISSDSEELVRAFACITSYYINNSSRYRSRALWEVASAENADTWLVAIAKLYGLTIVTQEKSKPNAKTKIHIPDICQVFSVDSIDLKEFLEEVNFCL